MGSAPKGGVGLSDLIQKNELSRTAPHDKYCICYTQRFDRYTLYVDIYIAPGLNFTKQVILKMISISNARMYISKIPKKL